MVETQLWGQQGYPTHLPPHSAGLPGVGFTSISYSLYLRCSIPGEQSCSSHPTQSANPQSDHLAAGSRDLVAVGEGDLLAGVRRATIEFHAGGRREGESPQSPPKVRRTDLS